MLEFHPEFEEKYLLGSLRQWFNETYISFDYLDATVIGQVYEVGRKREEGTALEEYYFNVEGVHFKFEDMTIHPFPTLGMVNIKSTAYWISRIPARQWRKGLSLDVLFIATLSRLRGMFDVSSKDVLTTIFNKKYYSFDEAFNKCKTGTATAAAFSEEFAWFVELGRSNPSLKYKHFTVGYAESPNKIILSRHAENLAEDLMKFSEVDICQ